MTMFIVIGCLGGLCYLVELLYRVLRVAFRPRRLKTFAGLEPDAAAPNSAAVSPAQSAPDANEQYQVQSQPETKGGESK